MTPQVLMKKIRSLPERAPHAEALERLLLTKPRWYASQKEHWVGWLREYDGPGFYGRKVYDRDAAYAYNHCGCPPMVLWLGEAVGVDVAIVKRAQISAAKASGNFSSRCAVIRQHISWQDIRQCLRAI